MEIIKVTDLASYLGRAGIAVDDVSADLYVDLANGLVSDVVGELDPVPTRVKAIALEVAARGYRNPNGYTSVTTSFDDSSKTWRRELSGSQAGIYLTDAERDELMGLAGKRRARAKSIRLMVP